MYIEFRLPNGSAGQAAAHSKRLIDIQMQEWSELHEIPYKTKLVKYTYRVIFDNPENYSFWALTWEPRSYSARRWSLIEPMSPP